VPRAAYCAAVRLTIFVIAAAPVIPVVLLGTTPETSLAERVTAPVRPATLVTAADTVPLLTLRPEPTITAPAVLVVAAGSLAAARVPVEMLLAFVASVVALAASPETADEAIAIAVEAAAVSRPAASTVKVATDDAAP
jgi:hypothetical protein